jgi:predicted HicB family RNase H-like nuclease
MAKKKQAEIKRKTKSIEIDPAIHHKVHIAAITAKTNLKEFAETALLEKLSKR